MIILLIKLRADRFADIHLKTIFGGCFSNELSLNEAILKYKEEEFWSKELDKRMDIECFEELQLELQNKEGVLLFANYFSSVSPKETHIITELKDETIDNIKNIITEYKNSDIHKLRSKQYISDYDCDNSDLVMEYSKVHFQLDKIETTLICEANL